MQKCKVKSVKPIGKSMTYNVSMRGDQHNYKIVGGNFGVYTRNSHSAAYSLIAYQCAWLKIYYPIEFMCSLLSSEIANSDKNVTLMSYMKEAQRMDITVMKPNVNKSSTKFKIEKGFSRAKNKQIELIRSPLTIIDGLGEVAAETIVQNQPYKDFKDFVYKVSGSKVNKKVFEKILSDNLLDDSWEVKKEVAMEMYLGLKENASKDKSLIKKQMQYMNTHGDESFLWLGGEDTEIKL